MDHRPVSILSFLFACFLSIKLVSYSLDGHNYVQQRYYSMPQTGKSHINGFRSLLSPHAKLSNRGFSPALNLEKFRNRVTSTQARRAQVLEVEGEWDYWKLSDAVKSVKAGGIVILPTESCYTFIAGPLLCIMNKVLLQVDRKTFVH
mmetsp:Transcript_27506/g.38225  ORF Transcript_27506/g.38225 Transcript_27506/m.38225 type:complete len:147 (+) Transcript_27506:170-610(+)